MRKVVVVPIEKLYQVNEEETDIDWDFEQRKFKDIELREFTGLKDRKGREIYEGDIIGVKPEPYIVTYRNGAFRLSTPMNNYIKTTHDYVLGDVLNAIENKKLEVIGNIYENPELLKRR